MIQGFSNCYTFRLSIERNEDAILDIVIGANDIPDEIDKVKKTIQRLLNNYTPSFKKLEPKPEPAPEPTKLETASTPPKEPDGAKGLVTIYCKECGSAFSAFLKERQSEIVCRTCGHHTDLTVPLDKFHFTCPHCEKESWGLTNAEDPDITILCKCGQFVSLRWVPKAKEYRN